LPDGPLAPVGDLIQPVVAVLGIVGPPESAHADFDKRAAWLRFVKAERAKFVGGAGDGTARPGDNVRTVVNKISNVWRRPVEPRSVKIEPFVLQAEDDTRPVEARAAVEPFLRVGQIDLRPDGAIRNLGLGEVGCR